MSLESVRAGVEAAAASSSRNPEDIVLVAVSKGRGIDEIRSLYDAGHRDFGENRASEMAEKAANLPADIRWHFVGVLQSNKARVIRPIAHLLHSLDRESVALAWLKGLGVPPPVLVQVNVGGEEQKSGVAPEQAADFVDLVESLGISVRGLMTVPPVATTPGANRPHFAALAHLRDQIALTHPGCVELSMGMTDDFETAIEQGASIIRVGRAIFEETNNTGAR